MKTLKLFVLGTMTIILIQACDTELKTSDDKGKHCASSYEIGNFKDTINILYADGSKEGRWVNSIWANGGRIKVEEGYYRNNKKEGYWKFYNKDGTLKDSVEYKHDILVKKQSQ